MKVLKKIIAPIVALVTFAFMAFSLNSNINIRKQIYITGLVKYRNDTAPVEGATIGIRGTNIYCATDKSGLYKIDISRVADTSKNFVVLATYVGCRLLEVHFNYIVKKSTRLNMELSQGARGDVEKIILEKQSPKIK